jgi:hypothetical protein
MFGGYVLNGNSVAVPVCKPCFEHDHNTCLGHTHFNADDPDRGDCKEVFTLPNGQVAQCCCGMGGEKLEG